MNYSMQLRQWYVEPCCILVFGVNVSSSANCVPLFTGANFNTLIVRVFNPGRHETGPLTSITPSGDALSDGLADHFLLITDCHYSAPF